MSEHKGNEAHPRGARPAHRGHGGPMGHAMMAVEKPKNFKKTLKRFMGYLKPHAAVLVVVVVFAVISNVFTILGPKVTGQATSALFEFFMKKTMGVPAVLDFSHIYRIILLLFGLYLLGALFALFQQRLMASVTQKIVYNLRREMDEKLARLPLRYYDSHPHGEILSRVANDSDNINNTLQQSLVQILNAVVTVVGIIVMMLTISLTLTAIMLLIIPLFMLVIRPIIKRSQLYFKEQQDALGRVNGHVEEMLTGHIVVKAFGRERDSVEHFNRLNEDLYQAGFRAQFISGIMIPMASFINNLGYVGICIVGGIFAASGRLLVGDIQAFMIYARQFAMPLNQISNIANLIQSTIASAERVFEVLDEPEETQDSGEFAVVRKDGEHFFTKDGEAILKVRGDVRFENVSFSYKPEQKLIENMNIDVRQGQAVAIVGPTGAGKTTIVNLLMRFYDLDKGRITIDGIDISKLSRNDLRGIFGMVLQDTWLFNGTVRENIAYGRKGASDEEVVEAARSARADRFIRTLSQGYETRLDEEASNISQGQKQLLTIARAVLADPPILILDEATSNVDTRTEAQIQKAMRSLMRGRTSFVIAHRLSTIRNADLILVMNHGAVIEQGTHDELIRAGGFYADLYKSQFETGLAEKPSA